MTIALLMRALLSGNRALFEQALAELSGLAPPRIAGFVREPRSAGFAALYGKTGLPAHFLPVFRAALVALNEAKSRRARPTFARFDRAGHCRLRKDRTRRT